MRKLDYKRPKWDKENTYIDKFFKQWMKQNNYPKIGKSERIPNLREVLYSFKYNFHLDNGTCRDMPHKEWFQIDIKVLKYKIVARDLYNYDTEDTSCMQELFLSALVEIIAQSFCNDEIRKQERIPDDINLDAYYLNALYMFIATNQTDYECFNKDDNIVLWLYNQNIEKAREYLDTIESKTELDIGNMYDGVSRLREIMLALINKDAVKMKEEMISRIRKYRRNGDGYLTAIDFISIAFIKMAKKQGMDIEIDVIEIPKFFFDDEVIQREIDKDKIITPLIQGYLDKAKGLGYV